MTSRRSVVDPSRHGGDLSGVGSAAGAGPAGGGIGGAAGFGPVGDGGGPAGDGRGQIERRRVTVDEMLAEARGGIRRLTPAELDAAMEAAAGSSSEDRMLVIDIRDRDDRERTGMIPGSISIPLIALEWRCDPASGVTNPAVRSLDQQVVTVCNEGYASSLAAASLKRLGFERAGDLVGGVENWDAAGLPLVQSSPAPGGRSPRPATRDGGSASG